MTVRHALLPALVAAALAVGACAPGTPPPGSQPPAATTAAAATTTPAGAAPATPASDTGAVLVAYDWQLESATDGAGQSIAAFFPTPEKPLGIAFADGRVGVTGGCNRIGAGYRLVDAANLQLSPGVSTMMACPPPQAGADAAFGRFLAGTLQVAIGGEAGTPRLRLAAADGSTLTFSGTPTPETRFGGPGTRAFLEVSPAPCAAPAPSARPCLTVRDVQFDEKGLRTGEPGAWRALPEGIEGYAPAEGEVQVVRVKRFEKAAAAGGEPKVHYVLDLVIETRAAAGG